MKCDEGHKEFLLGLVERNPNTQLSTPHILVKIKDGARNRRRRGKYHRYIKSKSSLTWTHCLYCCTYYVCSFHDGMIVAGVEPAVPELIFLLETDFVFETPFWHTELVKNPFI